MDRRIDNFRPKKMSALLLAVALFAGACSSENSKDSTEGDSSSAASEESGVVNVSLNVDESLVEDAVVTYADGVHASYEASLASAKELDVAIDAFVAEPSDATLQSAKDAWLAARDDYSPTEVFRFYEGPIDNEETGKEGLINAWPLDEAYIDYVDGDAAAGIINNTEDFPEITMDVLLEANEVGGESNISTGWHAIEFLLWGQDLNQEPGAAGMRPFTDYTTAENADRRGVYLSEASDLLLIHLEELVEEWEPDADNYRKEFVESDPADAFINIITGIGEMSGFELSSERMNVAYEERSQEDEHSCFSDNTHNDIIGNAAGVQWVYEANYPGEVSGTSIYDVVKAADPAVADELKADIDASVSAAEAIPAPFDQHLVQGLSDDEPGRQAILAGIESLDKQTDTIVRAADAVGVQPKLTE